MDIQIALSDTYICIGIMNIKNILPFNTALHVQLFHYIRNSSPQLRRLAEKGVYNKIQTVQIIISSDCTQLSISYIGFVAYIFVYTLFLFLERLIRISAIYYLQDAALYNIGITTVLLKADLMFI